MKINIDKLQLSDIYNLNFNVFYPLTKFVSKKQFINVSNNMKIEKNKFFPFPIYFSYKTKIKKNKIVKIYYNNNFICDLKVNDSFTFDINQKKTIGYKIFSTKNKEHPGLKKFLFNHDYFIDCEIRNFKYNKKLLKFTDPKDLKKRLQKNDVNSLVAFHTRNVPHKAHQWIHDLGLKKINNLLIQPLVGQYRKGEYKESIIIKTNKFLVEKIYRNKNVYFATLYSYPRYAGPREALLHSLIRKNYGCTHFFVGRDHAGIDKYYGKYESQKICKYYEKKIGINIIAFKEPYLCLGCRKIINRKCKICLSPNKLKISGTFIRNLLLKNKKIPNKFMDKKISKMIDSNSLIH